MLIWNNQDIRKTPYLRHFDVFTGFIDKVEHTGLENITQNAITPVFSRSFAHSPIFRDNIGQDYYGFLSLPALSKTSIDVFCFAVPLYESVKLAEYILRR